MSLVWSNEFSNSLILLFVSIVLFRYIYSFDGVGSMNYIAYSGKSIVASILFIFGILVLFVNFGHFLPEKIARYMSSPITLNLIAYVFILYVFSERQGGWSVFIALLVILILLVVILNVLKVMLNRLFVKLQKMKEAEKKEKIVDEKRPIEKRKNELKKEEKMIRKAKVEVKKEEKVVRKETLKELDKQKNEVIRLKKVVNKSLKKRGRK